MKYWRLDWDQVMDSMSWRNAIMLNATIPTFGDDKSKCGHGRGDQKESISFFEFGEQLAGLK